VGNKEESKGEGRQEKYLFIFKEKGSKAIFIVNLQNQRAYFFLELRVCYLEFESSVYGHYNWPHLGNRYIFHKN